MKLNTQGFTLIEAVISVSFLGLVALGVASLMSDSAREEKLIRVKQEAFSYQQNLRYERKVSEPPASGP